MSPNSPEKRGERLTSSHEQDLGSVLDRVCESYWIWYVQENLEYLSPRFWKLLGQPAPVDSIGPPGQSWQHFNAQEQRRIADELSTHIDSKGELPFCLDLKYQHASGQPVWLRCEAWVVAWDNSGKPLRVVGTHRDITSEKLDQILSNEISELRARFIEHASDRKKFFQYLLDKILLLTESEYGFIGEIIDAPEGKYLRTYWLTDISWNEETKRFYEENAPKGLVFKNLNTLFGAVIRTGRALLTNDPAHHPAAAGIPVGHPPLNSFMGIPIYYTGKFIAMAGVANRPNGYNQQLYSQMEPYFEVVGEVIHAKLIQDQLDEQVRLTLHNDRLASIGQLAAGVGHEINNPLSIISGQLFVMDLHLKEQGVIDPELAKGFQKIENSVNRIANIVGGLKSFSRADEKFTSHFSLQDLVDETVGMLRDIFSKEGVQLLVEGPRLTGMISGHRNRVQQVLVNLLCNAKDATEGKSERQVSIEGSQFGGKIGFLIRDNGCGIAEEYLEKIFEPFFTTKGLGNKGTGIGLAIVNNILKEHHAAIKVESQVGIGTTFRVEFPQSVVDVEQASGRIPRLPPKFSIAGKSIVVVDDEEDIRLVLQRILVAHRAQVAVAGNGHEALELFARSRFDIIISDIKMPLMGGFRLYEEVSSMPEPPVFVLISGGVELTVEQQLLVHQQRLQIIRKPFTVEQVLQCIEAACLEKAGETA